MIKLVAFVVNGIDEWDGYKTAYNGGTGVIPAYRGKRLTSTIYDFLEPKFKAAGIEQCTLEVIKKNDKAVKVYEHIGFEVVRGFNCFAGSLKRELRPLKAPFLIRTRKDCDWDNWEKYWEYNPSWENSKEAIERNLDSYIIEELMDDEKGIGYIIFHPKSGRISQLGVDRTYRNKGFGKQLLKRVMQHNSNVSINNVESNAWAMLSFLQKCGFKNPINQYEMKKMLIS